MILLSIVLAALLLTGACLMLPAWMRGTISSAASTLTNFTSSPVLPGGSLSVVLLAPDAFRRGWRHLLSGVPCVALALVVWDLVLTLSSPSPTMALTSAAYALVFFAWYLWHSQLLAVGGGWLSWLASVAPLVVLEASLAVVFRLSPTLESAYLASPPATFISGPSAAEHVALGGFVNNVSDPDKSGGLFLNGNVASMFLGVTCCLYLAIYILLRHRWAILVSIMAFGAIFFTGSKTGLLLALSMPLFAVGCFLFSTKSRWSLPVLLLCGFFLVALLLGSAPQLSTFTDEADGSASTRARIWSVAGRAWPGHEVLGLGFGGWDEAFLRYGRSVLFSVRPAHNLLIQAWADGGLIQAALITALCGAGTAKCLVAVRRSSGRAALSMAFCAAGSLWVPLHGLFDNTLFCGDSRTLPFYAALLVLGSSGGSGAEVRSFRQARRLGAESYVESGFGLRRSGSVLHARYRRTGSGR